MEDSADDSPSLTEQLRHFSGGDRLIAEAVLRKALPELHRVAVRELKREHNAAPLSPTELIHEVWLRKLSKGGWQINSREHFYAIAALAMRRVLIDFARIRAAQRRGDGKVPTSLNSHAPVGRAVGADAESLVTVGILMERLEKQDPQTARIVDMHYFAGFTLEEMADITGMTFRQVRHRWERGRDFLKDGLRSKNMTGGDGNLSG
jgi:RNA polymerase sigma factor (TIGR02999 family)